MSMYEFQKIEGEMLSIVDSEMELEFEIAVSRAIEHKLEKAPEQIRRKATRSLCRGSIFAWTLNTKPEKG